MATPVALGIGLVQTPGAIDTLDPQDDVTVEVPLSDAAETLNETAGSVALPQLNEYVVGYRGALPSVLLTVLGGSVQRQDDALEFAVVTLPDASIVQALVGIHPDLLYVEDNGPAFAAQASADAAQWDAAQWDAAQWDAAQWDAAQWDAAQWDAAQWDAAQWDAAQWDASSWDASSWDGSRWDASQWDATERAASQWDVTPWNGQPRMDAAYGISWHLGAIHAPDAWRTTQSYHTRTVCVVDSGIDATHSDIARNVKRLPDGSFGYDFVDSDAEPTDPAGHGTHMAGIVAGVSGNARGITGVSQAHLLAARVLNDTGVGTEAALASGIRWCADADADIVLMALHMDGDNSAVKRAVKYAHNAGTLLVAASGNDGARCPSCVPYPAGYDEVLAVGATGPDGRVAAFSNGGNALDVVAPGVKIPGPLPGERYAIASGTSQASAVAAGAAAIAWGADTTKDADDVKHALEESAKDAGVAGRDDAYGHGHLRLDLALAALD